MATRYMYIGTAKCAENLTPLRPFVPELHVWALKSRRLDHQSFRRILVLRTQHSAHTSTLDTGTIPWAKRSSIVRLLGSMVGERLILQLSQLLLTWHFLRRRFAPPLARLEISQQDRTIQKCILQPHSTQQTVRSQQP